MLTQKRARNKVHAVQTANTVAGFYVGHTEVTQVNEEAVRGGRAPREEVIEGLSPEESRSNRVDVGNWGTHIPNAFGFITQTT